MIYSDLHTFLWYFNDDYPNRTIALYIGHHFILVWRFGTIKISLIPHLPPPPTIDHSKAMVLVFIFLFVWHYGCSLRGFSSYSSPATCFSTEAVPLLQLFFFVLRRWLYLWRLFCLCLFLTSPSFSVLGRLWQWLWHSSGILHYENTPIQIYRKKSPPKTENWFFSYFYSKHRLWVLVRTASVRRF